MPGWAIADAGLAVVLAFVLGVVFVLVRMVAGTGLRRHRDDDGT
jgi:hypothetical protein